MHQISSSIHIPSEPSRVWSIISNLSSWSEWNTYVTSASLISPSQSSDAISTESLHQLTPSQVGQQTRITIQPDPNSTPQEYTNTISLVVPEREFRWGGSLVHQLVFDTEHYCTITPDADGKGCTFEQGEIFKGALVPVIATFKPSIFDSLKTGYDRMNGELRERCGRPL